MRTLPPVGVSINDPTGGFSIQMHRLKIHDKGKNTNEKKIEIKRNDEKKSDITYTSYKTGQNSTKEKKKDYYHVFCKC